MTKLIIIFILLGSFIILFPSEKINRINDVTNSKNKQDSTNDANTNYKEHDNFFDKSNPVFDLIKFFLGIVLGGIVGFFVKKFFVKRTQFLQRFDKTKELFAEITAHIINNPGEEFVVITRYKIRTDTEILTVCSYLRERKSKKLIKLYKKYQKQADGKSFDGATLVNIMKFK